MVQDCINQTEDVWVHPVKVDEEISVEVESSIPLSEEDLF